MTSPERNGTCENMPPTGARVSASLRGAPLGVPVVPLVRITNDEYFEGRGAGEVLLRLITDAMVSSVEACWSGLSGLVGNAMIRPSSGLYPSRNSAYSAS
ncbi:Uncharacterised protein [Mycobacteroides abscessus subsp. abscessus]|nr:Uncharacterised protein [Mycobacteroides abscessus subsp. abscessus]